MTYSAGSTILADDYNTFVGASTNSVNSIWSTSWNQTSNVANVSNVATTVTATQWAGMVNTLTAIGGQTATTLTARTAPVAGNTITILSAVATDLASCYTNRFNAAAVGTQFTGWTGTNSKLTQTGTSGGAAWTISFVNTVTFANSTAATSFFNQGGLVKIEVNKNATGLTGDPAWNNLAGVLCGDIYITKGGTTQTIAGVAYTGTTARSNGTNNTGTPTTLLTGTGWDSLVAGAAGTIVYKQFSATAPYTVDFIQHTIAKDATSAVLTITTLWSASDTNTPPVGGTDPISGGTAVSGATFGTAPATLVTFFPPSTTYVSNNWGSITVAATTT